MRRQLLALAAMVLFASTTAMANLAPPPDRRPPIRVKPATSPSTAPASQPAAPGGAPAAMLGVGVSAALLGGGLWLSRRGRTPA